MSRLLLDTNVIVRLLVRDPPAHHSLSVDLLQRGERGELEIELKPLVMAETVYVLESFYRSTRADIAEAMQRLLAQPWIHIPERSVLVSAVQRYKVSRLGFADCYLAACAQLQNAVIVTFDADLRDVRGVSAVSPNEV